MLVLSRKVGESVMIGDGIKLTVIKVDRGKVRIGIEAPKDIKVFRQELLEPLANPEAKS
jgi:carbon storage regulator